MSIPGLTSIPHMIQTASQGLLENAAHNGAEHFASQDVAHLSNRQAEKPSFFQKVNNVFKEMGHILRRAVGYRTPEEMLRLHIAMVDTEASHTLNTIVKKDVKKAASKEELEAYSEDLLRFSVPGNKEIFLNAIETKLNSLSSLEAKQDFIANLKEIGPHIKPKSTEVFPNEDVKKQTEACARELRDELAEICSLTQSGTSLHGKLDDWIDHFSKIQELDKINYKKIDELIDRSDINLSEEEQKAINITKESDAKQYNFDLVKTLKSKLEKSTIDTAKKSQYTTALDHAEKTYNELITSSFSFSKNELADLKPYLTSDDAKEHIHRIIIKRIQKKAETQAPSPKLVEEHYKSFEEFLNRYQADYEKSDLKLEWGEEERLKRLRKNFDTSKPMGTKTVSRLLSFAGMEEESSKNMAAGITQLVHDQAKGWAVNSILGSFLRPIMGERGSGFVTTATLSSLSGMRPGEALRHTGTSFVIDHFANKVLEDKHPAFSMGWGFLGRGMIISQCHKLLGNIGLSKVDDSVSGAFSRFWKGLKS